jgi:hypothetical protein
MKSPPSRHSCALCGCAAATADHAAPVVVALFEETDSTLLVTFSEPLEQASSETAAHYAVGAHAADLFCIEREVVAENS